jgi:hypothetical protein
MECRINDGSDVQPRFRSPLYTPLVSTTEALTFAMVPNFATGPFVTRAEIGCQEADKVFNSFLASCLCECDCFDFLDCVETLDL